MENWRFFARLGPAEAAAVVKADAYGLGAAAIAPALAAAGCRTFFVATLGEALTVRAALGPGPAIYILGGVQAGERDAMIAAQLTPVLNSMEQIALWAEGGPFALHIDTGMNRLGVPFAARGAAAGLKPVLLMSHLACSPEPTHPKNARQRLRFLEAAATFPGVRLSLAASAGALLGPAYAFDMIRPGIGLYGGGPLLADNPPLAPAARLEAPLLEVFDVPAGESVGYAASFIAERPVRVATAALGYADGVLWTLSGKGYGFVRGARCPFLGRVSMDLITLDVTDAPGARAGDWAEFLGPQVPLDEVAALAGAPAYEVLTSFARVRRIAA